MEVKRSDDNSCMMIQIKLLTEEFIYSSLAVFIICGIVISLGVASPMKLFFGDFYEWLFLAVIVVVVILITLISSPYRLFITLYDETEIIYCSIYNIYRKKLKDYTFSYNSVADIKLLEVWESKHRTSFVETEHYKKNFSGSYYAVKFIFKDNTDIVLDIISGIDAESLRDTIKNLINNKIYNNGYEE